MQRSLAIGRSLLPAMTFRVWWNGDALTASRHFPACLDAMRRCSLRLHHRTLAGRGSAKNLGCSVGRVRVSFEL